MLHGAIPAIMPFLTRKLSPEKYQADIRALMGITQPAAILTETAFLELMAGLVRRRLLGAGGDRCQRLPG